MKILVVGAHPDDCEIGAGGLLALHDSVMLSVTNGANDSRSWTEARSEMERAGEVLGCEAIVWDHPMDVHCSAQLVAQLDELIRDRQIDTLVTHFVQDTNQAHREIAEAAIAAGRRIRNLWMMEPSPPAGRSWQPFRPQLYADITSVADRKAEALQSYDSQMRKYGEGWVVGVSTREIVRGWEAGVERAEAFEILRMRL